MRNQEVVEKFVMGYDNNKGSNLYSEDSKLINYKTVIAFRSPEGLYINNDYYSRTTVVHQNRLKDYSIECLLINEKGINEIIRDGNTGEEMILRRKGYDDKKIVNCSEGSESYV